MTEEGEARLFMLGWEIRRNISSRGGINLCVAVPQNPLAFFKATDKANVPFEGN